MQTQDKTYNGWTNYETWNVNLWLTNNQGDVEHWSEKAQDAYDGAESDRTFTREENAVLEIAASLKNDYEDAMADVLECAAMSSSIWADLLGAALSEVNWREIAEHMIEDVDKKAEPEDEDENGDECEDAD